MSCLSVGRRFYGRDLASPELRTEGSRIPRPLLLRGLRGARAPLRKRGAKRRAVRERGQRLPVGTAASYSEPPGELSRGRRLAERAKKQWRRTSGSPPARSGEWVKGGISPGRTVQRSAFRRRLAERAKKQRRRTPGSPPARSGECVKGGISPGRTVQSSAFRWRLAERAKKTMAANPRFAASAIGEMRERGDSSLSQNSNYQSELAEVRLRRTREFRFRREAPGGSGAGAQRQLPSQSEATRNSAPAPEPLGGRDGRI